jgi:hypothetical protein
MKKHRLAFRPRSVGARARNTKPFKAALLLWAVFLVAINAGYAMQPPPPPLNLANFKSLVSLADVIVVGKVGEVRETEKMLDGKAHREVKADLRIEKLLKGNVTGETLTIQESSAVLNPSLPRAANQDGSGPKEMIVASKAGPSTYHGHYTAGMRIIVLLEKVEGAHGYRPLGSGSYNKYLCEFLVEPDGIKPFYFKFAEDMSRYAESEDRFVDLIKQSRGQDS